MTATNGPLLERGKDAIFYPLRKFKIQIPTNLFQAIYVPRPGDDGTENDFSFFFSFFLTYALIPFWLKPLERLTTCSLGTQFGYSHYFPMIRYVYFCFFLFGFFFFLLHVWIGNLTVCGTSGRHTQTHTHTHMYNRINRGEMSSGHHKSPNRLPHDEASGLGPWGTVRPPFLSYSGIV